MRAPPRISAAGAGEQPLGEETGLKDGRPTPGEERGLNDPAATAAGVQPGAGPSPAVPSEPPIVIDAATVRPAADAVAAPQPSAMADGPATTRRSYRLPIAALLLLALVWGYSWVVMKIALDYVQPWTFAALRTVIGGVALLALLPLLKRPLKPKAVGSTAVLGVLQTTGFVGFLTWALEGGGAGKTSILTYTMPFWLLLLARLFLKERLKGFQWAAVGLALCGLLLVLTPWRLSGGASSFIAVGGALFWAASAVYAKSLRSRHQVDLLSLTAWQMLFGAVPLIVIALATWTTAPQWPGVFIAALLYVAILGNALAWILWLYILNSFSAGTAGLATLLTPVIGISSAWIQLGERPGLIEGLGMIAIVGALLLVALRGVLSGRRSAAGSTRRTPR